MPFPLSGHVLRRSRARIAYLANPTHYQLLRITRVLGHTAINQTQWYIGFEYLGMAVGLARFYEHMRKFALPAGA